MKNTKFKGAALTALLLAAGPALADQAETKGGIKVKTDDGRFEANINGRIHYDAYVFSNDEDAQYGSGFKLNPADTAPQATAALGQQIPAQGGFAFRRTYLTLTGKAYGWKYKFENDFSAQTGTQGSGFREMWIAAPLANDQELIMGQFKPRRGLEEITSSNEITMMERPSTSEKGVYSGRQFLMGAGYKGTFRDQLMLELDARGLGGANTTNEGWEYGGRVAWFPMTDDGHAVHVGLSYSIDQDQKAQGASPASVHPTVAVPYAGRRGPSLNFGTVGAANPAGTSDSAQKTIALEYGASFGPVTLQAEYAQATLEHTHAIVAGQPLDSTVEAGYMQASWFVTGERTVYKKDRAAFGKPKLPLNSFGAIELTARYDFARNKDEDATTNICSITGGMAVGGGVPATAATMTKCEAKTTTVGVNWYVNPNVRYMLNYYMADVDLGGTAGKDSPTALSMRAQFAF